jgi:hypothetical protein
VWIFTDASIPVELSSFNAIANNGNVKLNWTTATELNNSGFEILRRTQRGENWQKIGFVPGFGTTTERHSYSFIDDVVENGTYDYRLKQIDFDGSFEYSNIVEVQVIQPFEFSLEQNYPNPFNPSTKIKYSIPQISQVQIKVFDVLGNELKTIVNEEKSTGTYEITLHAENLPSGVYFYQLRAGEFVQTKKMLLLK